MQWLCSKFSWWQEEIAFCATRSKLLWRRVDQVDIDGFNRTKERRRKRAEDDEVEAVYVYEDEDEENGSRRPSQREAKSVLGGTVGFLREVHPHPHVKLFFPSTLLQALSMDRFNGLSHLLRKFSTNRLFSIYMTIHSSSDIFCTSIRLRFPWNVPKLR